MKHRFFLVLLLTLVWASVGATEPTHLRVHLRTGAQADHALRAGLVLTCTNDSLTIREQGAASTMAISAVQKLTLTEAPVVPPTVQYTVTFLNADGTVLQSGLWNEGTTPVYAGTTPQKAADAQYSYTFAGWSPELTAVVGNATYTATYTAVAKQYTITFRNEDGSVLQTSEWNYGAVPVYTGATPQKASTAEFTYVFAGWDKGIVAVTGEATYTATFTAVRNQYTITFINADGTTLQQGTWSYGALPVYAGATPQKAADAQYSYTFAGWSPELTAVVANATYMATYIAEVNQYTITALGEHGTIAGAGTYDYGTTITLTAQPEAGYHFEQWEDGDTTNPRTITVTEHATYTAVFVKDPDSVDVDNVVVEENVQKVLENGHIIIIKDGVRYTVLGARL